MDFTEYPTTKIGITVHAITYFLLVIIRMASCENKPITIYTREYNVNKSVDKSTICFLLSLTPFSIISKNHGRNALFPEDCTVSISCPNRRPTLYNPTTVAVPPIFRKKSDATLAIRVDKLCSIKGTLDYKACNIIFI